LAISVAQVDEMSGGRVELGLGAGWFADEHLAYGFEFPDTGQRFDQLQEQLAIVTGLWATPSGERFAFAGEQYQITDSPGLPKPRQSQLPIIMGGHGARRTPALAAQYATEFNLPFGAIDRFIEQRDRVSLACEDIDRDPNTMAFSCALVACCGSDEAEVSRRAAAIGRESAELRTNGAAGTVSEVIDTLGKWRDIGVERVYLQILDLADLDHLELIAREVAPHLN
jgi:alkanesulfonate monooxygenase SsuD/methylene tetrahydromethanopterin reductase-like flavin-dependent oxidoreductase (luciferase family)